MHARHQLKCHGQVEVTRKEYHGRLQDASTDEQFEDNRGVAAVSEEQKEHQTDNQSEAPRAHQDKLAAHSEFADVAVSAAACAAGRADAKCSSN